MGGEKVMRSAVTQSLVHYLAERPHQGLDNELTMPLEHPTVVDANIDSSERIGDCSAPIAAQLGFGNLFCDQTANSDSNVQATDSK